MTYLELRRRQMGWSQKQLGDDPRIRIHQTFISMLERGTGVPVAAQRERIARVLGLKPDMLLATVPEGTPVPENFAAASEPRG
jgi:transcriptional regulator with XRE-family HTH domain